MKTVGMEKQNVRQILKKLLDARSRMLTWQVTGGYCLKPVSQIVTPATAGNRVSRIILHSYPPQGDEKRMRNEDEKKRAK